MVRLMGIKVFCELLEETHLSVHFNSLTFLFFLFQSFSSLFFLFLFSGFFTRVFNPSNFCPNQELLSRGLK